MISSIIQDLILIKIQPIIERARNDKESMICLTPKQIQSFFVYRIQSKKTLFTEKELLNEEVWKIEQKTKRRLFNSSCNGD